MSLAIIIIFNFKCINISRSNILELLRHDDNITKFWLMEICQKLGFVILFYIFYESIIYPDIGNSQPLGKVLVDILQQDLNRIVVHIPKKKLHHEF